MHLIETQFSNFENFKKFAIGWDLDFKLLSRNNFNAYLNMYSNETFQLARTSFKGTIHQNGLIPNGFRTIVIPATIRVSYNWLNKEVNSEQLLIFPRNGTLDSVSFDNFDVFVLSISKERLSSMIASFGFLNAERVFVESEKYLYLKPEFLNKFSHEANFFLEYSKKLAEKNSKASFKVEMLMIENILHQTLKYIDQACENVQKPNVRGRDLALKKSIDFILESNSKLLSVRELCDFSKVSERTLEYAFLEKYQVSPSQYIKAHHLNLVKNELILAKGRKVKVADIAAKYGFSHMGQFSLDFKRQYGVSPSRIA